jgi:hypothetical protein
MKIAGRAILVFLVLAGGYVYGQEIVLPEAPSHKFLDRKNVVAFSTMAGLVAVDAATTQRLVNKYHATEVNPLWRPMVKRGWQGELAASALGYGAAVSLAYTFHKTGHHKLERWANWLMIGTEAGNDTRNLIVLARVSH